MPDVVPLRAEPRTVLLVEDEDAMRALLKCMLEMLGFQVQDARDGYQALRLMGSRTEDFHLVVSDFRMPGMDGVETLAALRKLQPVFKAVLCSGYPEEDCLQGRPLAGSVFLPKPFTLKELSESVR